MTITVDRLDWWCDICAFGMTTESAELTDMTARMHETGSHPMAVSKASEGHRLRGEQA